jgi:hypothetical protein
LLKFRFSRPIRITIVTLIFTGCIVLGFVQNFRQINAFIPQTEHSLTCSTALSANQDIFNVYFTEMSVAEIAQPLLCNNAIIKRQYGNVRITVGQNEYDTFRYINHGIPELTLIKSNVMTAFAADLIYGYDNIASHPDYNAYFIALREKPELTKEYLLGKTFGLLDYPSSRSGHIVPKTVLQKLGLNDSNIRIRYYNSHQELRQALLSGDVDIISSYWSQSDEDELSKNYTTALEQSVSGMRWYVKMQTKNTDLRCALQDLVMEIAASHPRSYYHSIELVNGCNDD